MPNALTFFHRLIHRGRCQGETTVDIHAPLLSDAELNALIVRVLAAPVALHFTRDALAPHSGDARSARLGHGLDFEESRLYQRGDDVRAMDWRTTARSGKPYLKIYREEHQPVLHLVVDRGASMRFGTRTQLKVTQAARLAVLCAWAAVRSNTCIGGTLWQPAGMTLPCRNGEAGALQLARAAIAACPPLPVEVAPVPAFTEICYALDAQLPAGSRIVLLSDFARVTNIDAPALRTLAARHDVRAIQILDAAECDLPEVGQMRFADLASGATGWLDTHAAPLRETFHATAAARFEQQRKIFTRAGIAVSRCMTHDDAFEIWQNLRP